MDNITLLRSAVNTLNTIDVHGKENLDKMLGCINVLEHIAKGLESMKNAETESEDECNG